MDHEIKNQILQKLMHNPGLSFNELWDKSFESNKFAYHLKFMQDEGLVIKNNMLYFLSDDGKVLASFSEGETGKREKMPVSCLLLCIFDKNNNILLYQRTKEPFYGYSGFIGGKLKFGEEIIKGAKRELKEETNLDSNLKIAGFMNFNVYVKGKHKFHNYYTILKGFDPQGTLCEKNREGLYKFVSKSDFLKENLFPDNLKILELVEKNEIFTLEVKVEQEDGKFLSVEYK